jgi:hypothetical protein
MLLERLAGYLVVVDHADAVNIDALTRLSTDSFPALSHFQRIILSTVRLTLMHNYRGIDLGGHAIKQIACRIYHIPEAAQFESGDNGLTLVV